MSLAAPTGNNQCFQQNLKLVATSVNQPPENNMKKNFAPIGPFKIKWLQTEFCVELW